MRKLTAFSFITLNGYFKGPGGDIGWHRHGEEEAEYSAEGLRSGNTLLFGRVTYQMMAGYWPSAEAIKLYPVVAEGMNGADKIVFSRTLKKAEWHNTTLMSGNIVEEIERMKRTTSNDMTILGSGSIISQCAEHGLIDEYQIMVDPVALGDGTPLFKGIDRKLDLRLIETRTFKSSAVLLSYQSRSIQHEGIV